MRRRKGAATVAVIPRQVYDDCEQKLYQRADLVKKASEKLMFARSIAYSVRSSMPEPLTPDLAKRPGVNPNSIHGSGGNGLLVGAYAANLDSAPSNAGWNIGSSLSCKPPLQ